jgi:hypothetical protein
MKKRFTLVLSLLVAGGMAIDMNNRTAHGNSSGAPAGNSGSPADGNTCARSGCHLGGPSQTDETVSITGNIPCRRLHTGNHLPNVCHHEQWRFQIRVLLIASECAGNQVGHLDRLWFWHFTEWRWMGNM